MLRRRPRLDAARRGDAGAHPRRLERVAVERARARLEPLALYPGRLRTARVRILHVPWLFRMPWFRRFDGYCVLRWILLRHPVDEAGDDLIAHEMVHVWQQQHGWLRMWLSYVRPSVLFGDGYWTNRYEVEARAAVDRTRPAGS